MKRFLLILMSSLLLLSGCNSSNIAKNDEIAEIRRNNGTSEIIESNDLEKIIEDEIVVNEQLTEKVDIQEENQSVEVNEKKIESKLEQSQSLPKQETKVEKSQENVNNVIPESNEISKEKNVWEELGMTKEQYENTPMGSWRKVTHSSYEDCKNVGQSLIDDESNNYTTFWCYEVISYSGKQLGYMLDPE